MHGPLAWMLMHRAPRPTAPHDALHVPREETLPSPSFFPLLTGDNSVLVLALDLLTTRVKENPESNLLSLLYHTRVDLSYLVRHLPVDYGMSQTLAGGGGTKCSVSCRSRSF